MPLFLRNHIVINGRTETLPYTSPNTGRSKVVARPIGNRQQHGENIRQQFETAVDDFNQDHSDEDTDFVYVVFKSPLDVLLDIDKFDKGNFRLASYKKIPANDADGTEHDFYEATVCLNRRAVAQFLSKVEAYLNRTTPLTYNDDGTVKGGGNPFNQTLIANIEEIRAATLQSFWQEPELAFPGLNEDIWWEVWLSRDVADNIQKPIGNFLPALQDAGVQIGDRFLQFPEHWVYLMRATASELSAILYSDKLAEIRKPRDTADFFTTLERQEQAGWIANLVGRTDNFSAQNNVAVCLLDTGVNRNHPLLENLIPQRNLDTINPAWTVADTGGLYGHGTPMASLALYGDLTDVLGSMGRVQIYHHFESIKFINHNAPHDPALYGAVTQEAIARGEVINPGFKRIICMAVTSADNIHRGRPTSWSAAIDQTLFGSTDEPNDRLLMVVSSGNLPLDERINYPLSNADFTIQDPAQSYNSITVGAYTLKDIIDLQAFPDAELLARRGAMSPCNTTSIGWLHEWCKKPDIVMEGGNLALQNGGTINPDSLVLLSASRGGLGHSLLTTFNDTSASTALASKFLGELYVAYPALMPETIRALTIHSAVWTPEMLANRSINQLTSLEKERLLANVGYGVPNMEKARYSANNSLSMIIERTLTPFKLDGSAVKTNEFHLFDLPWPVEVLQELLGTIVNFKITLSYFIEPNPGNKQYELSASYKSHGLRFKMINPNESEQAFRGRISRSLRDEGYVGEGRDQWILGSQLRDKGSIHKDIWEGTAADLATRNKIAVYPIGGWWKNRKKLGRYNSSVNYSLVMTIETPAENTDIYTPVLNQITIEI
ncbi:MAG: S8 family peptidase [Pseudobacter sp.]|uniref:S8 family peptidase n=1 Tax=Pseudobacter sp. TaxID=2045420 RepID=UPI003F7DED5B